MTQDMYCHNAQCPRMNAPQGIRYVPATFYDPADWVEDPICTSCREELYSDPLDVVGVTLLAFESLPEDPDEWTPEDRDYFIAAQRRARLEEVA